MYVAENMLEILGRFVPKLPLIDMNGKFRVLFYGSVHPRFEALKYIFKIDRNDSFKGSYLS